MQATTSAPMVLWAGVLFDVDPDMTRTKRAIGAYERLRRLDLDREELRPLTLMGNVEETMPARLDKAKETGIRVGRGFCDCGDGSELFLPGCIPRRHCYHGSSRHTCGIPTGPIVSSAGTGDVTLTTTIERRDFDWNGRPQTPYDSNNNSRRNIAVGKPPCMWRQATKAYPLSGIEYGATARCRCLCGKREPSGPRLLWNCTAWRHPDRGPRNMLEERLLLGGVRRLPQMPQPVLEPLLDRLDNMLSNAGVGIGIVAATDGSADNGRSAFAWSTADGVLAWPACESDTTSFYVDLRAMGIIGMTIWRSAALAGKT